MRVKDSGIEIATSTSRFPLYCGKCGVKLEKEAFYCGNCGYQILGIVRPGPESFQIPRSNLLDDIKEAWRGVLLRRLPISRPSSEVYEWREPFTSPVLLIALATIVGFLVALAINVRFQCQSIWGAQNCNSFQFNPGVVIGVAVLPAFYFGWLWRQSRLKTEPLTLIVLLFGLGALSVLLALGFEVAVLPRGYAFLAGVIEEPCKILGVYYVATRRRFHKEFNGPMDGLVWGAAVGAGFAIVESAGYLVRPLILGQLAFPEASSTIASDLIIRNLAGPGHMVWTGIVAWWLGMVKASRGGFSRRDLIPGLSIAVIFHGLWNALGLFSILLLLPIYAYLFHKLAKEAHREELAWGYQSSQIPKLHHGIMH